MERRIVFATGNENKMAEIRMILSDLGMPVYSMKELGVEADIVEDGISFEENAEIKARAISRLLPDDIVLADDSGLEIDYLDKGQIWIRRRGSTPQDLRARTLPMMLRTVSCWTNWRGYRMKSVLPALCARWRLHFRTEVWRQSAVRSKVRSQKRCLEKMASDTIPFSTCRNMAAQPRRWIRIRKTNSATGEMPFVPCTGL